MTDSMSPDILPPPPPPITRSPAQRGRSTPPTQTQTTPLVPPMTPPIAPMTPLLVYSHGQTQVDTFTPNSETIQRALYTWSQVADYSVVHCERLPLHNGAALEPLCAPEERSLCPGHPWIDYSYHCKVKEWTQDKRSYAIQQQIRQQQTAASSSSQQSPPILPPPLPVHPQSYMPTHMREPRLFQSPMPMPIPLHIAHLNTHSATAPNMTNIPVTPSPAVLTNQLIPPQSQAVHDYRASLQNSTPPPPPPPFHQPQMRPSQSHSSSDTLSHSLNLSRPRPQLHLSNNMTSPQYKTDNNSRSTRPDDSEDNTDMTE